MKIELDPLNLEGITRKTRNHYAVVRIEEDGKEYARILYLHGGKSQVNAEMQAKHFTSIGQGEHSVTFIETGETYLYQRSSNFPLEKLVHGPGDKKHLK